MKTSFVIIFSLLAIAPAVMSSKCYVCGKADGNCKTGETDCGALDMCLKITTDKAVAKTCANKATCDAATAACKQAGNCKAICCKGNLCNTSSSLKSITMLTFVAPLMAVARYLM